ncbi:MAG: helix-turn-helix domain-containing protein [Lachnospiraceae bacterium]|nr:helix-turn-helix domain-containing protein [Lachnospiraceae bacterium]
MEVRELRLQTGLSQSKFAQMFDIPVSTLKDWEQERRNPPTYVINMMRTILQYKGMLISQSYIEACDERRVMANYDQKEYLRRIISDALQGEVKKSEYSMDEEQAREQYQIAKVDYEAFRENIP